jgi:hypothetical protein
MVLEKAGKKRHVILSPVHFSALLNNNSRNSQCSVSLGCGVYYIEAMMAMQNNSLKRPIKHLELGIFDYKNAKAIQ